ncbi:MAG TPA: hypothetical protein VNC84_05050 [Gammaproteobacteria bacterium]|jgi:hypothetical protein|nr:hypothetical protein [Gammaproteobacteria bacterium]
MSVTRKPEDLLFKRLRDDDCITYDFPQLLCVISSIKIRLTPVPEGSETRKPPLVTALQIELNKESHSARKDGIGIKVSEMLGKLRELDPSETLFSEGGMSFAEGECSDKADKILEIIWPWLSNVNYCQTEEDSTRMEGNKKAVSLDKVLQYQIKRDLGLTEVSSNFCREMIADLLTIMCSREAAVLADYMESEGQGGIAAYVDVVKSRPMKPELSFLYYKWIAKLIAKKCFAEAVKFVEVVGIHEELDKTIVQMVKTIEMVESLFFIGKSAVAQEIMVELCPMLLRLYYECIKEMVEEYHFQEAIDFVDAMQGSEGHVECIVELVGRLKAAGAITQEDQIKLYKSVSKENSRYQEVQLALVALYLSHRNPDDASSVFASSIRALYAAMQANEPELIDQIFHQLTGGEGLQPVMPGITFDIHGLARIVFHIQKQREESDALKRQCEQNKARIDALTRELQTVKAALVLTTAKNTSAQGKESAVPGLFSKREGVDARESRRKRSASL